MPLPRALVLLLLPLLPALGACAPGAPAAPGGPLCAAGQQATSEYLLFFGLAKPGGQVSEAEWQGFLDGVLVPAFPDGLTVFDAEGRWLDPDLGRAIAEPSKVVAILAFDPAGDGARVAGVADRYKAAFQQQAVLVSQRPACVAFR